MTNNTLPNQPIHITPHHLSLSPALRDFVSTKLAKVRRFANDLVGADIVLRRHHGTACGKQFSASARLALPGRDIHGIATHANLYSAIVKLVSRLAGRARRRNTRLDKSYTPRPKIGKSNLLSHKRHSPVKRSGKSKVPFQAEAVARITQGPL